MITQQRVTIDVFSYFFSSHHRPGSLYEHISKTKLQTKNAAVSTMMKPTSMEELAKQMVSRPEPDKVSVASVAEQRRILFHQVCEKLRTSSFEGKSQHYWKKVLLITILLGV
jgi:hypothetical protein